jgi:hypothetical protein
MNLPPIRGAHRPPPLPDELRAAYARAIYTVSGPAGPATLRIGTRAPPLDALTGNACRRIAIVTAFNPFSQPLPEELNRQRARDLELRVADAALRALPASGTDPDSAWEVEPGLAVLDADDDLLDRWMVEFEQHAVVVADAGRDVALRLHPGHRTGGG